MKDLGKKLIWCGVVVAIILWFAWGVVHTFGGLDNIKMIGNGSLLVGFIKLPFCLFGGVQFMRGIFSIIGKDAEKMEESGCDSYPLFVLYLIATIAGLVFFYLHIL